MNLSEAKVSSQNFNSELFSLNPSAIITMFEIDITDIAFEHGLISYTQKTREEIINDAGSRGESGQSVIVKIEENTLEQTNEDTTIFRFHNSINLTRSHIFWQGKKYVAAPINAEGYELSTKGVLPTPKISISIDSENTQDLGVISLLKQQIALLGGLVGAKVTRIRTFVKNLDEINFYGKQKPKDFNPDPFQEFPRDIFWVDRKSGENKFGIELELGSLLDVEGVSLPLRPVVTNRCPVQYRGWGCLYEFNSRRVEAVHGKKSVLPTIAPPVANNKNEKISVLLPNIDLIDRGRWSTNIIYNKGDYVFVEKNGIKYYFVCKENNPLFPPPNLKYWIADQCAKDVIGCKCRWNGIGLNTLPFMGFPTVGKAR